jgi:hypothetical protein
MLAHHKRVILFELESTYGSDPTPTGADAILCSNLDFKPLQGSQIERDFIKPFFGGFGFIRVENFGEVTLDVEIAGSGTAGTAPSYNKLLKACNLTETLTAAAITGTGQAGGSTTTIKLAAGASATDDYYVGMSIEITGGTGDGQAGEIIAYNGTTKVATVAKAWATPPDETSEYSIGANALYTPNSDFGIATANTSGAIYFNVDGVRHILLGARGTVSIDLSVKTIPKLKFRFLGLHGTISDSALPTADTSGYQIPVTISTANTTDLNIMGYTSAVMKSFTLDLNNELVYRQLVGAESVLIKNRKPAGKISIEATTVAAKDWWTAAKNATYSYFAIKHGQTAGNIFGVTGRYVQLTEPTYMEDDGVVMMDAGLSFTPYGSSGNDEVRFCIK